MPTVDLHGHIGRPPLPLVTTLGTVTIGTIAVLSVLSNVQAN